MKQLFSKILIVLALFSISAELSTISFNSDSQYVMTDTDESDKKEKEEIEKDKILNLSNLNFLYFKKESIADFFIPNISTAFIFLPEIPPKQV